MTVIGIYGWSDGRVDELSTEGRIEQASRAQAIAVIAHRGQKDKLGEPYIEHVTAVASRFDPLDDTLACCAAWLHDVLEDTRITVDDLAIAGIHDEVIEVVQLLTRRRGMGDEYYERIALNEVARQVKRSDLFSNTHPSRTELLDEATRFRLQVKYEHAFAAIGEPWPEHFNEDQIGGSQFGSRWLWEGREEGRG